MCGIAGIVQFSPFPRDPNPVIHEMTLSLSHRGPDAQGTWVCGPAALGHRRLIVVDPAGGIQPMTRTIEGRTCVIVYNGELYNTDELRRKLTLGGHHFDTRSDTEVVLRAFMAWGPECARYFIGIFAFAVWDALSESVTLVRDPVGVKPLFYHLREDRLVFGSEIKALLHHPGIEPILDEQGLCELFGLGPARTPGCGVFRDIREVLPGTALTFGRDGVSVIRYWELVCRPHRENLADTAAHLRELLTDAVERQLVSDVPLGTFLSGGLDSSAISAVAAAAYRRQGRTLDTFSVDYVENDRYFRESLFQPTADAPFVRRMSAHIGSRHHDVMLDAGDLAGALSESMRMRDLPGMADIDSSLLVFCRRIRSVVTVALSGECADELLGGYPWFHRPELMESDTFPWSRDMAYRTSFLSPALRQRLDLAGYARARYEETLRETPECPEGDPLEIQRRRMFYLNMRWFMANLLDRKDRMSMASGLEVRVPFTDPRLIEYIWNIPWEMKRAGNCEKGILRMAMEGQLPEDVLRRRKSPYPKTFHPAYTELAREMLRQELAPGAPLLELADESALRALMECEDPIARPWFGQLMSGPQLMAMMAQTGQWLRHYRVCVRL